MRDILFRGKNIAMGKFVEGDLRTYRDGAKEILKTDIEWADGKHDAVLYPVDKNTVGEFTGLFDKNDMKVFEGDIFHLGDINIKYIVEYMDTGLSARQIRNRSCIGLTYWQERIEVIGNIHDNPELLEAK